MIKHWCGAWVMLCAVAVVTAAETEPIVAPTAADKALAARAVAAAEVARATPAREPLNLLMHEWPSSLLLMLAGEKPATAGQLASARGVVAPLVALMEQGKNWPPLTPITVPRARGPIRIDGDVGEAAWQHAWTSHTLYLYNHTEPLEKPGTCWRLLWDERYLYAAFECDDSEIVTKVRPRDDQVYKDDCVEVFLHSDAAPQRYWEIVVNPSDSVFDALHTKKLNGWGPEPGGPAATMEGLQFATRIRHDPATGKPVGYTTEMALPLAQLPGFVTTRPPQVGDKLYGVLARLDVNGGTMQAYAFVPLLSWGHNIWNHVPLVLGQ